MNSLLQDINVLRTSNSCRTNKLSYIDLIYNAVAYNLQVDDSLISILKELIEKDISIYKRDYIGIYLPFNRIVLKFTAINEPSFYISYISVEHLLSEVNEYDSKYVVYQRVDTSRPFKYFFNKNKKNIISLLKNPEFIEFNNYIIINLYTDIHQYNKLLKKHKINLPPLQLQEIYIPISVTHHDIEKIIIQNLTT